MKPETKKTIRTAAFIMAAFFTVSLIGCGAGGEDPPRENKAGFPEQYTAEQYQLLPEGNFARNIAAKDGILYLCFTDSGGGQQSTRIAHADLREEAPAVIIVPYLIPDDEYVDKIYPNDDGTLSFFVLKYDSPNHQGTVTDQFIKVISLDGELKSQSSVFKDLENETAKAALDFMTDGAGRTYLTMLDRLYVWEKDGRLAHQTGVPGMLARIARSPDGQPYLFWSGVSGYQFAPINQETGVLGTSRSLGTAGSVTQVITGINSDFLLVTDKSIYEYDLESGSESEMVSFSASGLTDRFYGILAAAAIDKMVLLADFFSDESRLYIIGQGEWPETADKTGAEAKPVLTFGMAHHHWREDYAVDARNFNGINDDIQIEVRYYGSNADDNGVAELALDIISGRAPDIILIPRGTPMDSYISKGVFADLYPLLDADPTISRDDLVTNILNAYETDGKLFSIPLNYRFFTMAVPASVAAERKQWNLEEMMSIADSYLPDSLFFLHDSKSHVLEDCLKANTDYLLRTAEEGQGINRELLIKILEFANRFAPADSDWLEDNLASLAQEEGMLQCYCCEYLTGVAESMWLKHLFGGPITLIGYPSESGSGNLIHSNYNLAISSFCENKEAAWRFIRGLLAEKKQFDHETGSLTSNYVGVGYFPLLRSALDRKLEDEMRKNIQMDENGEMAERPWSVMPIFGRTFERYAAREDEVAAIRAVIENADTVWSFDTQVFDIISEEAGKYFDGGKSVEETIDIIENRLRMYLLEREN